MNPSKILGLCLAGSSALWASVPSSRAAMLVPTSSSTTLVDSAGTTTLNTWSKYGGYAAYLTDSATLIGSSGQGTGPGAPYSTINEVSWTGTLLRSWTWKSANGGTLHHAHNIMPNGHWLAVGYNQMSKTQLSAKGVTISGTYIYDEHILEYDPATQKVVWEWVASDHMGSSANRLLINASKLSTSNGDALHFNSVSYDPIHDLIMVSSHMMNEILVIDHSTADSAAAALHTGGTYNKGGDILFRWGSATNYGGTSATVTNVFHGGNFVPPDYPGAGNFLVFANTDKTVSHSRAYEVEGTLADTGYVVASSGEYEATNPFSWYSSTGSYESAGNYGNVQRMANGNTFITFTKSGKAAEIDSLGNLVQSWTISSDCKRALRYPYTFVGLSKTSVYTAGTTTAIAGQATANWNVRQGNGIIELAGIGAGATVRVLDAAGRVGFVATSVSSGMRIPTAGLSNGLHIVQIVQAGRVQSKTLSLLR